MKFITAIQKLEHFEISEQRKCDAHREIAPFRDTLISDTEIAKAKKAAVLLLVHPHDGQAHFTLIERSAYDGIHSKQIALPGGKVEKQDSDINETALREAHEEVNINPDDVKIISELSPIYVPPSNFYITPILGISEKRPNYIPEIKEVNHIIEVPLAELLKGPILKQTKISISKSSSFKTPYMDIKDKIVWGATAMILNELRHFLK
ncbi:MAG: 8-oxo-dGTP pyrophosphatase MutT (NUDIX family) [Glaciecola sp.]